MSADVVLGHAIYTKTLEILTSPVNKKLRSSICLRLNGFEASCIFLSVIGKLFGKNLEVHE